MKTCENCKNQFEGGGIKFCSRSCSSSYNNKIAKKRKLSGHCKTCQSAIPSKRTYCDSCFAIYCTKKFFRTECEKCGNKISSQDKRCISCKSQLQKEKRKQLKNLAIAYKGGKCSVCSYDKCLAALEFHHLDPTKKEFSISSYSINDLDLLKLELDKCILLCSNCHREIHYND